MEWLVTSDGSDTVASVVTGPYWTTDVAGSLVVHVTVANAPAASSPGVAVTFAISGPVAPAE